jgi:hypothetical protein
MKTNQLRSISTAAVIGMAACLLTASVEAADVKDINTVFQQGRAAYYKGDLETAKALLTQVAAVSPNHFETKALLAQINTYSKADTSLKKTYSAVTIPKVEFNEVTLSEALQALGTMSKNASAGKVIPNVIVKNPEMGKKMLTLSLSNIPMTDVIDYLARMSGGKAVYEKHAVVLVGETE